MEEQVEKVEVKTEKSLKEKIQEKLDDRILKILDKDTLTVEEYVLLEKRMSEIRQEESTKQLYGSVFSSLFR